MQCHNYSKLFNHWIYILYKLSAKVQPNTWQSTVSENCYLLCLKSLLGILAPSLLLFFPFPLQSLCLFISPSFFLLPSFKLLFFFLSLLFQSFLFFPLLLLFPSFPLLLKALLFFPSFPLLLKMLPFLPSFLLLLSPPSFFLLFEGQSRGLLLQLKSPHLLFSGIMNISHWGSLESFGSILLKFLDVSSHCISRFASINNILML